MSFQYAMKRRRTLALMERGRLYQELTVVLEHLDTWGILFERITILNGDTLAIQTPTAIPENQIDHLGMVFVREI